MNAFKESDFMSRADYLYFRPDTYYARHPTYSPIRHASATARTQVATISLLPVGDSARLTMLSCKVEVPPPPNVGGGMTRVAG